MVRKKCVEIFFFFVLNFLKDGSYFGTLQSTRRPCNERWEIWLKCYHHRPECLPVRGDPNTFFSYRKSGRCHPAGPRLLTICLVVNVAARLLVRTARVQLLWNGFFNHRRPVFTSLVCSSAAEVYPG